MSKSDPVGIGLPAVSRNRLLGFILASLLPPGFVWISMHSLVVNTIRSDTYSHIPLIPVVSFYLIYLDRKRVFANSSSGWRVGTPPLLVALFCFAFAQLNGFGIAPENVVSVEALGIVLAWVAVFAFSFGWQSLRAASFPFLFLSFMVPIPEPILGRTIFLLQEGSASVAAFLFNLFGVPFLRQGFDFALPGVTIRVAEECSGIRSTLALLIMSVLAVHMFLRRFWSKALLCVLVIPLALFKNGLRIVTLSMLSIYVDSGFLHGRLHQYGGIVFFGTALVPLALLLLFIQKNESPNGRAGDLVRIS